MYYNKCNEYRKKLRELNEHRHNNTIEKNDTLLQEPTDEKLDDVVPEISNTILKKKEPFVEKDETVAPKKVDAKQNTSTQNPVYMYDAIIERLNLGNSENKKYDFEWDETPLLNYADDSSLEIAYNLIERGKISLSTNEKRDSIHITSFLYGFCDNNMTNDDYFQEYKKDKDYNSRKDSAVWKYKMGEPMNASGELCYKCKYQSCPKFLAAYILYLKNQGTLKEKLITRKKYREENNVTNGFFLFEWKSKDGLKKVDDKSFEFANELVDKEYVRVERCLIDGKISVATLLSCKELQLSNMEMSKLSVKRDWKKPITLSRKNNNEPEDVCVQYTCRFPSCVLDVAGYIYYLKMIGQDYKIKEDRDYYSANKEQIDKEIKERIDKELERLNNKKEEKVHNLKKSYDGKIENLNLTINSIMGSDKTNFHCIVVGDDKEEKDSFIDKIVALLQNENNLSNVRRMSAVHFARMYYHYTDLRINKEEKLVYYDSDIEDSRTFKRDKNNIPYKTDGYKVNRRSTLEDNSIYILDDIKEFVNDFYHYFEGYYQDKKMMTNAIDILTDMSSDKYIIINAEKDEVEPFISLDTKLKFVYQNGTINIPTYSIEDMYNSYLKLLIPDLVAELRNNEEEYKKLFNEYVSLNQKFMPFTRRETVNYMATYANTRNELVLPPNIYKKENLDNLIGLDTVKEKLKEFEKYMLFQIQAKANEINIDASNMHMIFTGNPGTGKTTVARIMAKMLFDLGIVKENKLIEVERKDLIAKYVGQTASKTAEVIDKAMGGVLFIDEAYSLAIGSGGTYDYGAEAVATLIKAMEDHKDNLVVIFAGYRNEMKKFTDMNPGIASRIGYTFDFPDYSVDNLIDIFNLKLNNSGFEYEKNTEIPLRRLCEYFSRRKNFGNGRFINKVIQETLMKHALSSSDNIKLIRQSDIPSIEELNQNIYKNNNQETAEEMLNNLIGMESIKKQLIQFKEYADFVKKAENEKMSIPNVNMHMIFTGNPGTGKTTVARIIAKMLFDMEIIHENKLIEVERKDLIANYLGQTASKTAEVIERAMGGVLFIDEAYSLANPNVGRDYGSEAIATLIKAMEDYKGSLVVIFAGYRDEMKTFVDMNPGIASRIGYTFDFEDYSVNELTEMFFKKMKKYGFEFDTNVEAVIKSNCEYYSKRKNFGNGRFVDKLIQGTLTKHAHAKSDNIRLIKESDIPSIEELNQNLTKNNPNGVEEMLSGIIGMENIKKEILQFRNYVSFIKKAQKKNLTIPDTNMHMIFTGNPGTGKTTIARIIAKMLFDMEIIHENKLIEVERKDLIGEHMGSTAPKTNEVIEKAMGGVLFIDEAYSLAHKQGEHDSFGDEAIATLIKAMEDHKGEFVVIFAGYRDEMKTFVDMNPGIASRIGYTFNFEDYSVKELMEMFYLKMNKFGFECENNVELALKRICGYYSKRKNFGNGRFVDKVIQKTLVKHANRNVEDVELIDENDIPTIEELNQNTIKNSSNIEEMFASIVGMKELKEEILSFGKYIAFVKEAEKQRIKIPDSNMHMIFTGNSGTGKTTVARIIAKMLFDMEVIHENKLIEVERKDLVAGYIGQTAIKTNEVIEKAMGGVLFIDEAYTLASDVGTQYGFGEEAIATLIKAMEDHKGEFVVIFAGYKQEMKNFIDANPGIASRVGYTFNFEDYSDEELAEIFYKKVSASGMKIEDDVLPKVKEIMKYFYRVDNIGNGRFVDKVFSKTLLNHSKKYAEKVKSLSNKNLSVDTEEVITIKAEDLPTIQDMTKTLLDGNNMIDPSRIDEKHLRKTAIHEVGHATVGYLLLNIGFKKITCTAEGMGALGYVESDDSNDSYTHTKDQLLSRIKMLLAGIGAEEVFLGVHQNGGSSDLRKATSIARDIITVFGMSDLGLAYVSRNNTEIEKLIYDEENRILDKCFKEVKQLISENKDKMQRVVDYLIEHSEIGEKEFAKIFNSSEE